MTRWLDRRFVLGCVIAATTQFAVAGIHLLDAFQNGAPRALEAGLWVSLGSVWLVMAMVFRGRNRPDHA